MSEVLSGRYFKPAFLQSDFAEGTIGKLCASYQTEEQFPDYEKARVVLLGVGDQADQNTFRGAAPDLIRESLYTLFPGFPSEMFADIGNLIPGQSPQDTYAALSEAVAALIGEGKVVIILGGGQDLTLGNYMAYERLGQTANLVNVDSRLDLGAEEEEISNRNYISKILLRQPNFLFNFSLIGYQTYHVNGAHLQLLDKLYFDSHRLGQLKGKLQEAEPIIRNADFASIDLGSVRFAEAPGSEDAGPNGFTGEEICQLMRYAGMSDKLSSIGIYEYSPEHDERGLTAGLTAQMIWYFLDGVFNRKLDFPVADKAEYLRYRVVLKDHDNEIIFYKSGRSERWWMDVPYPAGNRLRFQRHHLVPCTYEDYLTACRDEMPDRWWKTWQKLS